MKIEIEKKTFWANKVFHSHAVFSEEGSVSLSRGERKKIPSLKRYNKLGTAQIGAPLKIQKCNVFQNVVLPACQANQS